MKSTANTQLEEYRRLSEENLELRMLKHQHVDRIGELLTQINMLDSR